MGIPDRESYLLTGLYPTGTARGWRRTGCLVMLGGAIALCVVALLIVALTS